MAQQTPVMGRYEHKGTVNGTPVTWTSLRVFSSHKAAEAWSQAARAAEEGYDDDHRDLAMV